MQAFSFTAVVPVVKSGNNSDALTALRSQLALERNTSEDYWIECVKLRKNLFPSKYFLFCLPCEILQTLVHTFYGVIDRFRQNAINGNQ